MKLSDSRPEAIFAAAVEITNPLERNAFLDRECADDPPLRAFVEKMLDCHDTDPSFLETPAFSPGNAAAEEQAGEMIGRYRLIEQIGEGGFGRVWRSEQTEPVRREVALKITKRGLDTRQIIARFEAERQVLAIMNHPNIATVLDAGSTDRGRPYFVMELVEGKAIDEFCEMHSLSVEDRLKLFIQVCRAVLHAHQRGILHRDLKPTNILISPGDHGPVPKIIDFGISKAMSSEGTRSSGELESAVTDAEAAGEALATETSGAWTAALEVIGTPEYMSPEQVTKDPDIDTRSDVYALGGVLYKLLTGAPPLPAGLQLAGLDELIREIQENEPLPPSKRLVSAKQQVSRRDMAAIRGDLDWIVMKALEKDRERRYESAAELAQDIERHLANEPVLAGPASLKYRARKFARRHRMPLLAATLFFCTLIAGMVAATFGFMYATVQWQRAELERKNAQQERNKAQQERNKAQQERERAIVEAEKASRVAEMLERLIAGANPSEGRPADFTMREHLEEFAATLGDKLAEHPLVEARLRRTVGRLFLTLREFAKAGPHLKRALQLRQQLDENHPLLTQSQVDYARYLYHTAALQQADQLLKVALPRLRKAEPSGALVEALDVTSLIRYYLDENDDWHRLLREAWSAAQKLHGPGHPIALRLQSRTAVSIQRSGGVREEAERLASDALEQLRKVLPEEHPDIAQAKIHLAKVLSKREDLTLAELLVRDSMEVHRKLMGEDSVYIANDLVALARILRKDPDRRDEALEAAREAVRRVERTTGGRAIQRRNAYRILATLARRVDPNESVDARIKAVKLQRELKIEQPRIWISIRMLAFQLRQIGRFDESAHWYAEALAIQRKHPDNLFATAQTLQEFADLSREIGELTKAEALLSEAIEMTHQAQPLRSLLQIDHLETLIDLKRMELAREKINTLNQDAERFDHLTGLSLAARAILLMAESKEEAAEPILSKAAGLLGRAPSRRLLVRIIGLKARCNIALGRFGEAESLLLQQSKSRQRGLRPSDHRRVVRDLVALYEAWEKPDQAANWRKQLGLATRGR